ncbi:MAG: CARDB domain-containing protein [Thermoplasmata archaeon]
MKKICVMIITLLVIASIGTIFEVSSGVDSGGSLCEDEVHPTSTGSPDIPTWRIGTTWTYDQDFWTDNMDLDERLIYTVDSIEEVNIDGTMTPVYKVVLDGELIEGIAEGDKTIIFEGGDYEGYLKYRMDNLALVEDYQYRYLEGEVQVITYPYAEIITDTTTTNDPPLDGYNFPLSPGSTFQTDNTLHREGYVEVLVDGNQESYDEVDETEEYNLDVEVSGSTSSVNVPAGSFDAFEVTREESGNDTGTLEFYYNGNVQNTVKEVVERTDRADRISELRSYHVPTNPNSMTIEPSAVAPGEMVTVAGNFPNHGSEDFTVSIPMADVSHDITTDSTGSFSFEIEAPNVEDTTPSSGIIGNLGVVARLKNNPQDAYQVATLSVIDGPNSPSNPQPADGESGLGSDVELSVDVAHHAGTSMDVHFYDASDDSLIGTDPNVASGGTASVSWDDLEYGAMYRWYAEADDGEHTIESNVWEFTTIIGRTLVVSSEGQGSTDPEGTHVYPHGEEVTIEAIPEVGWYFSNWTGDYPSGSAESDVITVVMDRDRQLTANFETEQYVLTLAVDGGGSTNPPAGEHSYQHGEEVTITATPDEWSFFDIWEGDTDSITEGDITNNEITVTITDDVSLTAVFGEEKDYTLMISIEGEGSTEPRVGTHSYFDGAEETITATPDDGWYFVEWTGDVPSGEEENREISIIMDSDKTLTAHFEVYTFDLVIDIDGEGEVAVDPDQTEYDYGTLVELTAISENGWNFSHWSGDVPPGEQDEYSITITMDDDKSLTVHFEQGPLTPGDPDPEDGETGVSTDAELSVEVSHGQSLSMDVEFYDASDDTLIDTDENVESGGRATVVWDGLEYNTDYGWYVKAYDGTYYVESSTWNFTTAELYTLTIEMEGDGIVVVDGDDVVSFPYEENFIEGSSVELEAIAGNRWEFLQWEGDHQSTEKEVSISMDDDKTVTAYFQELEGYILTINTQGEGSTDPAAGSYPYEDITDVMIQAIPDDEWQFVEWTGDVPQGEEENKFINVTVDGDIELTAHFQEMDLTPANFVIDIQNDVDQVLNGERITITYTVKNTGEARGMKYIVFKVDGDTVRRLITLNGGEEFTSEFTWVPEEPGEYDVEVELGETEHSVTITVDDVRAEILTDNLLLIILLIIVLVAAIVIATKHEKLEEIITADEEAEKKSEAQKEQLEHYGEDWEKDFHDLFSRSEE